MPEPMTLDTYKLTSTEEPSDELLAQLMKEAFDDARKADAEATARYFDEIKRAKDLGYFIRVFFVATNHPSINAARITKRVMQGGHDVPITKIISRYQKSIFDCKCISELVDRLYIYDNSVDRVDARLLFRKAEGKLIKQYSDDIPEWAKLVL